MPTKRRVLIFLIVLSIMLFAKYVWGQDAAEQAVGWDPVGCYGCDDTMGDLALVAFGGPIIGMIAGLSRIASRNLAAKNGTLYQSQLVILNLGD